MLCHFFIDFNEAVVALLGISLIASLLPAKRTVVVVIASLIMNLRTGDHHQDRKSFGTTNHSLSSFQ